MGRLRRLFGNLSVIILKKKMELRSILILQGFKHYMSKTRKNVLIAHKRPWRITYRNKHGNRSTSILPNGTAKNRLLRQLHRDNLHVYGINNLTDFIMKELAIYSNRLIK
jgi:hypothetical protein